MTPAEHRMRRTWFLVGLTAGLVIALQPVWDAVRDSARLLADADERLRERDRQDARAERARIINETPVGWGETIDADGIERVHGHRGEA